MNTNPKVSIIIPFYNCAYVSEAIESALNQSYSNIEIIVVDDGSTRYTELVQPYLNKIRYIRKENGGTATALNMGIQEMTGEYFCWLSSDDLFDAQKVKEQIHFMLNNHVNVSYTLWNLINSKGKIIHYNVGYPPMDKVRLLEHLIQNCIINGCTIMIHKNVFQQVGIFDETLRYAHDYDMWLRIIKQYDIHCCHITLVNYRTHEEMGSIRYQTEQNEEAALVKRRHKQDLSKIIESLSM